jgi:hypothetical protein
MRRSTADNVATTRGPWRPARRRSAFPARCPTALGGIVVVLTVIAGVPRLYAAPLECGGISGGLGVAKIPYTGKPVECANSECPKGAGSFLGDAAVALCNLAVVPGSCGQCACCLQPYVDVFTGTRLSLVEPAPDQLCGFGGRGETMARAGLCLLRDLALPARAPSLGGSGIRLRKGLSIGIGDLEISQRVGFLSFDPDLLEMEGFHAVSICVPGLGCIGDQTQQFHAQLDQDPLSAPCSAYAFTLPTVLRVSSEATQYNLGLEVGPFNIPTPIGATISVKPRFDYETNLLAVTSPWAANNDRRRRTLDCSKADQIDVLGTAAGLSASTQVGQKLHEGWNSILALGSRDPDPHSAIWTPGAAAFPARPDFDFGSARDQSEKRPTSRFHAGVALTFGFDQLLSLIKIPPFSLDKADAFVTSDLNAVFASQFQMAFEEGAFVINNTDCSSLPPGTILEMQSAVAAYGELLVKAGIDIRFVLRLPPFGTKRFGFSREVTVANPNTGPPDPSSGPLATARLRVDTAPSALQPFNAFTSLSGGDEDGRAFLDRCFAEPPPAQSLPLPTFEPGDPLDLLDPVEFPCNLCLKLPDVVTEACLPRKSLVDAGTLAEDYDCGTGLNELPCTDPNCESVVIDPPVELAVPPQVLFSASQSDLSPDKRWLCDSYAKAGCYDLCTYDPRAAQPLEVVQSAVDTIGAWCRDAVGGDGPAVPVEVCFSSDQACDDGNPCTVDTCSGVGEFGTCAHSAADLPCDDGLYCNGADTCALGVCGAHAGNPCSAAGECCREEADRCATECASSPCDGLGVGAPCDDGSACTSDDRCVDGPFGVLCRGTAALTCTSTDPCRASLCDDTTGTARCVEQPSGECPVGCGNGVVDADETCDGDLDAACPDQCGFDCRCPVPPPPPPPLRDEGEPCDDDAACATNHCVDRVCCNSACDAPSEACNVPGRRGLCTVLNPTPGISFGGLAVALALLTILASLAILRRQRQ